MGLGGLSVGLATGINYGEIIESLLEIEQRPVQQLQEKINLNEIKQQAYDELNTMALTAKLSMFDLSQKSTFEQKNATSSDENVLTATATSDASVGTHQLRVTQLATSSVTLSNGFQDTDSSTIGAGTMSFELGSKRLDQGTDLDDLNDGSGIDRGVIRLTNTNGTTESFDMANAVTVQDALDLLNGNTMGVVFQTNRSIDQSSSDREVNGYKLEVINSSTETITLTDLGTGTTLYDLGFRTTSSKSISANSTNIATKKIYYVTESSNLSQVNDGFGIQTNSSGTNDIRFYVENAITQSVKSIEVDLSDAETVGDVVDMFNQAIADAQMNAHSQVSLSSDGVSLEFTGVVSDFTNINNSKAASDLGLTKIQASGSVYKGEALIAEMNGSLIRNLHGGNGIRNLETGVFRINSRRGDSYMVNLDQAVSVQDIIRVINDTEAAGQSSSVSIAGGGGGLSVSGGVLQDLNFSTRGFDEDRLVGSTITISTGGTDYTATVSDYDSTTGEFTLSNDNISGSAADIANDGYQVDYELLQDITAKVSNAGNGLEIVDGSSGNSTFRVDDLVGDVASQLGIESTVTNAAVKFNPIDINNDSEGETRTSTVFLGKESLPEDLNEDDMIGRSIEHVWSSRTARDLSESAIESAKIVAFESAGDDLYISDIDAAASSTFTLNGGATDGFTGLADQTSRYAGNEDIFRDETNLNESNVDEDLIVGADFTIYTDNGEFSSTILAYDSTTQTITLADDTISTELNTVSAGTETTALQSLGYTIKYNHKVTLKYDNTPTKITADPATSTYGANVLFDDDNIVAGSTTLDLDRLEGATITLYDTSTNTSYSSVVSTYDTTANTITFLDDTTNYLRDNWNLGGVSDADVRTYGYFVTYPPIKRAASSTLNFLTNSSTNPDHISIVGVGDNETIVGGNLENRILSSFTRLDDLNGGNGINRGQFSITTGDASSVTSAIIDLDDDSIQTIQDLIDEIKSNLANIEVEINDRGDGLRIYDLSSSQDTALTISDIDGSGTAASLNLIDANFEQYQIQVTNNADFYSLNGIATHGGGADDTIEVAEFSGLNREDVVGSKISYTDATLGGYIVHAVVTDYSDNTATGVATLTLAGQVREDGTDVLATYNANNTVVNLHLKKHLNDFESLGTTNNFVDNGNGNYTLTMDTTTIADYSNLEIEQLIGSTISLNTALSGSNGDFGEALGITAMITNFNSVAGEITVQTHDADASQLNTIIPSNPSIVVNIAKDNAPRNHVQGGGIDTANSYLLDIADSGFVSIEANVNSGGSTTTIISDEFANLDPSKVVGSLITLTQHTDDDTKEGQIAIVTGYNALAKAVTIGGFYDDTGTLDNSYTLDNTDIVQLTYASELEGSVIRSEAPTSVATTNEIDANLANKKYVQVNNILALAGQSEDALIGATITFDTGTGTTALEGESRTIVDIIHDYGGVVGDTVLVLDSELTAAPDNTDDFTISWTDITTTIDSIDFNTGVISTREKMQASMGDRSFNIHPVVDGSYQKEIQIYGTDTLEDIIDKINSADVGVDASVVNDGSGSNPYRISLISSNTGELGSVTVGTDLQNLDLKIATKAQDAKVILGDPTGSSSVLSSSTNILSEAIAGVTLNLASTSSSPVTLKIDYDREGITEKVTTVVDEVNLLLEAANSLIALETEVEVTDDDGNVTTETQKGVLFGDVATRTMINNIKFLLTSLVDNIPSGNINSYSEIGITLDSTGKTFEFDETVLQSALNSYFTQVQDLFTYSPNLLGNAGVTYSSDFLQTGFDINSIRNGITSSSGFSETGNGSNGAKFQAGDSTKYITYSLGETKNLYGFRFHHHIPTDLTARYNVTATDAFGATTTITAGAGTSTIDDDGTFLGEDVGFIEDQLIGATLTVNDSTFAGVKSATITDYDSALNTITLDADLSATNVNVGGYTITTPSGGNLDFTHKPIVEYLDSITGEWEVYQSFNSIEDGKFSVVFPGGLKTDYIRLSYENNNGDSEDFTENGYFVRLMEFEVLEAQGLAAQFSRTFDGFTNSNTGSLQFANQSLSSQNEIYTSQIERLGDSILNKQDQLIKQFQNLELVVSNLNNQSSFFQSQVNSLPKAFSFRGNNG